MGIIFCISQSAIFSGLNLAFFSLTRLRLEIEAEQDSSRAYRVLAMRKDSNFLLTTILWGNVGINVLLTLLSNSVMTGLASFLFSAAVITFLGEIIPQAYFSRHALRMASLLTPLLKFYQILLYPVGKPSALILDIWLGKESISYFSEENIKRFITKHIEDNDSEIDDIEGTGAINFLNLDDHQITEEGENINPLSIITLPSVNEEIDFPDYEVNNEHPFLKQINASGEKWIIITNEKGIPVFALDADGFIRSSVLEKNSKNISKFCHKPLIFKDNPTVIGQVIKKLKTGSRPDSDTPIDLDVVLLWTSTEKRIITGADLLGRLLKGI